MYEPNKKNLIRTGKKGRFSFTRRSYKGENLPPANVNVVEIAPLAAEPLVTFFRWATVLQIIIAFFLTGGIVIAVFFGGGNLLFTIAIGTLGSVWIAYETDAIQSTLEELSHAFKTGKPVKVWREGRKLIVYGGENNRATVVTPPVAWGFIRFGLWRMKRELPPGSH